MTGFSNRLQFLMKNRKTTQKELGEALNVKRGSVSNWITGRRMPDAEMLISIADYFDVSVDYLLGNEDVNNEKSLDNEIYEELYDKYADLSDSSKKIIDLMIDELLKKQEK